MFWRLQIQNIPKPMACGGSWGHMGVHGGIRCPDGTTSTKVQRLSCLSESKLWPHPLVEEIGAPDRLAEYRLSTSPGCQISDILRFLKSHIILKQFAIWHGQANSTMILRIFLCMCARAWNHTTQSDYTSNEFQMKHYEYIYI